jgi:WhiB family transcriptional regulator, redox-sensing transcriptional regulator
MSLLIVESPSTSWMMRATCLESDPELFFPIGIAGSAVEQVNAAKAICGRCEVRRDCFCYALRTMPHGIWGGTTMEERVALRARSAALAGAGGNMTRPAASFPMRGEGA